MMSSPLNHSECSDVRDFALEIKRSEAWYTESRLLRVEEAPCMYSMST